MKGQSRELWGRPNVFLILFAESLDVRFSVRIEEFLAALLPPCSEFRRSDVPVRPAFRAFLSNGTQVLTEIFQRGGQGRCIRRCRDFFARYALRQRGTATPVRYSFVWEILSALIVISRQ